MFITVLINVGYDKESFKGNTNFPSLFYYRLAEKGKLLFFFSFVSSRTGHDPLLEGNSK